MVNVGAHNTIDAHRHVGKSYRMGVNGTHNTVEEMLAPTILFGLCCARDGCRVLSGRCVGYGPYIVALTCVPCLTFSRHFLVLTERASSVG